MSIQKWLVAVTLAAGPLSLVKAEPRCPGNVTSLPSRLVQRTQLVTGVFINHQGPYDFAVDTGAQVTAVDPALAAELHLKSQETAGLTGVGVYARVPLTRLDSVEAGSHIVTDVLAVIQNLGQIQSADNRVRGILAGNFLEHFDLLVDYSRQMVCLDDSMRMRTQVKGEHIALASRPTSEMGSNAALKLILPARASQLVKRQLLLQLDSGSNAPVLYDAGATLYLQILGTRMRTRGFDGRQHAFVRLAEQDLKVGPYMLRRVSFIVPVAADTTTVRADADGLLPAALFQRVFVNYSDHYVVLDPW